MKPIIGILPDYNYLESKICLNIYYYNVILDVGALPIIIPTYAVHEVEELLLLVDGLMFTGGNDIDPKFFGESVYKYSGKIVPERDELEIYFAKQALKRYIPSLGICRGMQVMAIASGGDIYQDIYSQCEAAKILKHVQEAPRWYGSHKINIQQDTKIFGIYKKSNIYVNSFHHQAVRNTGDKIIVSAKSEDNVIEAIEHIEHPFYLGVQWHPESMYIRDESQKKIFIEFINSAKRHRSDIKNGFKSRR